MGFYLDQSDVNRAQEAIELINEGQIVQVFGSWFQMDIAKASGLNSATVRKIMANDSATKAQKAALKYAIVNKVFNLKDSIFWT